MDYRLCVERLEDRSLLAAVSVQAGTIVRSATDQLLGINLAWWDSNLNATTQQMVTSAGLRVFRQPGGSSSDEWHFTAGPAFTGASTAATFNAFTAAVNGVGVVSINYGTASPQEGAAWLAYCNAPVGSNVPIGVGPQWNGTAWVNVNWQTSGYWAALRAATPITPNDGLNHLRVGHAAPFGWKYWEVGNEEYGSWETDRHTVAHDPATYVAFSRQFRDLARLIDPNARIGVSGSGTGGNFGSVGGNWTHEVLTRYRTANDAPDFVDDHLYMFDPTHENDDTLLRHTATDPAATGYGGPINWVGRAAAYRTMFQQDLGASASGVELLNTEFNSVSSNPSNQTTSLVNGLFAADAIGGLLQTEYNMAVFWDLRNSYDSSHHINGLYGWRFGGDYGILGDPAGTAPASGRFIPYPTYFAEQLVGKIIHTGDSVVRVTSDDTFLSAYAVRQQSTGHLMLLVVNKSPTANLTGNFTLSNFKPGGPATLWQYGKTEDTAQQNTTDGHASLTQTNPSIAFTPSGANTLFSFAFPSYSMSVIDLTPAVPRVLGTLINDGTAQRSRVTSLTVTFDMPVTFATTPTAAFTLSRIGGGSVAFTATANVVNGQTVVTLSNFSGGETQSGSLADGRYTLTALSSQISVFGQALDGDNNGTPGGDYVFSDSQGLFRFFGDINGDRHVDIADFGALSAAFGTSFGQAGFLSYLDFNNDGQIDIADFGQFSVRFFTVLP
jgi:hypothetical protein